MVKRKMDKVDALETKKMTTDLLKLIKKRDVTGLQLYIYEESDRTKAETIVNMKDENSMTLLHHATRTMDFEIVEILVNNLHADIKIQDKDGMTPLHIAARRLPSQVDLSQIDEVWKSKGKDKDELDKWAMLLASKITEPEPTPTTSGAVHHNLMHFFVQCDDVIDMKDYNGSTALHHAASRGNMRGAKQLVADGADLECLDIQGLTPLMIAAKRSRRQLLMFLLENNANYLALDSQKNNLLHQVCSSKKSKSLEVFLAFMCASHLPELKRMVNATNQDGETPLQRAALSGLDESIGMLIEQGSDPTIKNNKGEDCMHIAVRRLETESVDLFLGHGMSIDTTNDKGETPLFLAIRADRGDMCQHILKKGASVDHKNEDFMTATMVAIQHRDVGIVWEIMKFNPDLTLEDQDNKTALTHAIEVAHEGIIKLLLDSKDAEYMVDHVDLNNDTTLHWAAKVGNVDIIKTLMGKVTRPEIENNRLQLPLHVAAMNGHLEAVKLFIEKEREDIWNEDDDGNTPFHYAAGFGFPDIVNLFVTEFPALRQIKNDMGRTPLVCAAANNHVDCVQLLLQTRDIDVNSKDKSNVTPLFLACHGGYLELTQVLLARDADPRIRVSTEHEMYPGWNALNVAIAGQHLECVREILKTGYWYETMKNRTVTQDKRIQTPFRQMIKEMPEAAAMVMDMCVDRSDLPDHLPDYSITYYFELLEDPNPEQQKKPKRCCACCKPEIIDEGDEETKEPIQLDLPSPSDNEETQTMKIMKIIRKPKYIHPLTVMIENGREKLLEHELVHSLLTYKWIRLIAPYLANVIFYFLFVSLFTTFMVTTTPPYLLLPNTNVSAQDYCETMKAKGQKAYVLFIQVSKYGTMVIAVINLLKEFAQFLKALLAYFSAENMIEILIYTLAISTTVDTNSCMRETGLREHWQWRTGTIGLALAWINILFFIQKTTPIGIYVGIFIVILRSLAKLMIVFSPFLIGFGIAFHLLLGNHFAFLNMANSITNLIAMVSGEVGFGGAMFGRYGADPAPEALVHYINLTYILFLFFVILIAIALMNMITGIAVGDVNVIQGQASIERLRMTIETLFDAQGIINALQIKWTVPTSYTFHPNEPKNWMETFFGIISSSTGIFSESNSEEEASDKEPQENRLEKIDERLNRMQDLINSVTEKMEQEEYDN